MNTSVECLAAGLAEDCAKRNSQCGETAAFQLGALSYWCGELIEGDTLGKKHAKKKLKALIGRGRCILNASDFEAGLKKGGKNHANQLPLS